MKLPSDEELSVETTRIYTGLSATDPLDFTTIVDSVILKKDKNDAGLEYLISHTNDINGTSRVSISTPAGRHYGAEIDQYGRVDKLTIGAPAALNVDPDYDSVGRLTQVDQSNRRMKVGWSSTSGYLESLERLWVGVNTEETRWLGGYDFDDQGWLDTFTRYDNKTVRFEQDANGNTDKVRRPKDALWVDHDLGHNSVDLFSSYNPPDVPGSDGQTSYAYDDDRRLDSVTWDDGTGIDLVYYPYNTNSAGKLQFLKTLTGSTLSTYAYEATTGKLSTVTTSQDVVTTLGWNGPVLSSLETTWSDAVDKSVSWTLDDYFRTETESVTGGRTVTYDYDDDGLIESAKVTVNSTDYVHDPVLHPVFPRIHALSLKKVNEMWAYNAGFSEYTGVTTTFGATNEDLYSLSMVRDDLGRVYTKTESVLGGSSTTTTYSYHDAGWLTGDGTTTWGYDDNGNRTTVNGATKGVYDDQDRLTQYDGINYAHDANGFRTGKGSTTTYTYDDFGNLETVSGLPGTVSIVYDLDGAGRRIGRTKYVNGLETQYRRYLLGEGNRVVAEYDGSGTLISQFFYATRANVPDFMIQGTSVYRLVTDQLGSVRLVVNVDAANAAASVVQEISYDAWGNASIESGASFDQPFGFAGGLWDRDTGLVHFGAREYDPEVGRWTSKEPLGFAGGDTNFYLYAYGDPVNWVDPDGTWAHMVAGAAIGGAAGYYTEVENARKHGRRASGVSKGIAFATGAAFGALAANSPAWWATAALGAGNAASLQILNNAARGDACEDPGEGVVEAAAWGAFGGAVGHGIGAGAARLLPKGGPGKLPHPLAIAAGGSVSGPARTTVPLGVSMPRTVGATTSTGVGFALDRIQDGS